VTVSARPLSCMAGLWCNPALDSATGGLAGGWVKTRPSWGGDDSPQGLRHRSICAPEGLERPWRRECPAARFGSACNASLPVHVVRFCWRVSAILLGAVIHSALCDPVRLRTQWPTRSPRFISSIKLMLAARPGARCPIDAGRAAAWGFKSCRRGEGPRPRGNSPEKDLDPYRRTCPI